MYDEIFRSVREREYPSLGRKVFLDAACVSLAPQRAVRAVCDFARECADCKEANASEHHVAMDSKREKAYVEAARLLNADVEEIALVESTTYGLNAAARTLKIPDGSRVLTTSLEFLQVAMPWVVRPGIEVYVVPGRDGRFTVEDFAKAMDSRTKLVVISSVQWCNGWRIDIEELGRLCKERGIYFVVDAVHHVGAVGLDVKRAHVDMLVAGGHKWLNSPFGCGILYVNRELLPGIEPFFFGYLNLETPPGGWPSYFADPTISPVRQWRFPKSARLMEVGGTSNYPGAVALGESLSLTNELGIKAIERHNVGLADYAAERLQDAGAFIVTPIKSPAENRSAIIVFRFYRDLGAERELVEALHRENVYVSMRFTSGIGGIRVSCHYFNNEEDIDCLVECLKRASRTKKPDYSQS